MLETSKPNSWYRVWHMYRKSGIEISLDGTTCTIKYTFADEERAINDVEKRGWKDVLTEEMFQKKDVKIITNYCDVLLGNDMKIIKDDNPVERKQDGTLSEKDDGYKGWYEKESKKICERYKVTKKRCENSWRSRGVFKKQKRMLHVRCRWRTMLVMKQVQLDRMNSVIVLLLPEDWWIYLFFCH